eukprot:6299355-Prymnesium_polylepis.1
MALIHAWMPRRSCSAYWLQRASRVPRAHLLHLLLAALAALAAVTATATAAAAAAAVGWRARRRGLVKLPFGREGRGIFDCLSEHDEALIEGRRAEAAHGPAHARGESAALDAAVRHGARECGRAAQDSKARVRPGRVQPCGTGPQRAAVRPRTPGYNRAAWLGVRSARGCSSQRGVSLEHLLQQRHRLRRVKSAALGAVEERKDPAPARDQHVGSRPRGSGKLDVGAQCGQALEGRCHDAEGVGLTKRGRRHTAERAWASRCQRRTACAAAAAAARTRPGRRSRCRS